jgi:hypothetical protein
MQIFPARDVEGMDERAAIIDARLMVMELLLVAGYPAGTTLQDTTADSTCVVIDSGWGIFAESQDHGTEFPRGPRQGLLPLREYTRFSCRGILGALFVCFSSTTWR